MIDLGLRNIRQIINVSGNMTGLGASSSPEDVVRAVSAWLPRFADIGELQGAASGVIRSVIGSESGCISACAASGICVAIASCMTGVDQAKVERLPETSGMQSRVVLQTGHSIWFGGRIRQLIELTGATAVEFGDATRASLYQMQEALDSDTAAALYVISHHTVQYGMVSLRDFCELTHRRGVPVIVDAASESYMRQIAEVGVDLVIFSGHKFLAGPTSGIIAGRRDLIEACLLNQTFGIGRPMKVGKEGIVGAIAALNLWQSTDHAKAAHVQRSVVDRLMDSLAEIEGLSVFVCLDPTGNPIKRVGVRISEDQIGLSAFQIAVALASGDPSIRVRDHEVSDHDMFELDPCNINEDEADLVATAIRNLTCGTEDIKDRIRRRFPARPNLADWEVSQFIESFKSKTRELRRHEDQNSD